MNTFRKILVHFPFRRVATVMLMCGVIVVACCATHEPIPAVTPTCTAGACGTAQPQETVDAAPPSTTVKITVDHLEFTLPDSGWVPLDVDEELPMLVNKKLGNLIVYDRQAFKGNAMQFALIDIYTLRHAGGVIVSAKNVKVNDRDWLVIEATSAAGDARLWYWIGFSQGFGYKFKCGGEEGDESQRTLCTQIGSTLRINP